MVELNQDNGNTDCLVALQAVETVSLFILGDQNAY